MNQFYALFLLFPLICLSIMSPVAADSKNLSTLYDQGIVTEPNSQLLQKKFVNTDLNNGNNYNNSGNLTQEIEIGIPVERALFDKMKDEANGSSPYN